MTQNPLNLRVSPSGRYYEPQPASGLRGWTVAAPLVVTLLAAGHEAGVYTIGITVFVRVAAGAGNLSSAVLAWSQIGLGATSVTVAPTAPTSTGNKLSLFRSLPSTGLLPITYTLTPALITGSPIVDVTCFATLVGLNVSS